MEWIGTAIIVLVLLFVVYRSGLMKLTQTASSRAVTVTDSATEVWELSALESHSKQLGKIHKKLTDTTVKRSSAQVIRAELAKLTVVGDNNE